MLLDHVVELYVLSHVPTLFRDEVFCFDTFNVSV